VGRIVALDVGERRIGIAVSDPSRTLARPAEVITGTGLGPTAVEAVLDAVARLTADEGLDTIVVGLPRRLDGTPTPMTGRVDAFAATLGHRVSCEVVLQDERLTSREAESRLAILEKDWRVRKGKLDAAAAALILQEYLDAHPPRPVPTGGFEEP
jgi:putative Holliday junction resolvase